MRRWTMVSLLALAVLGVFGQRAHAHCQVPCGIYRDKARVQMMREDITTIEKSVRQIQALAKKQDAQSKNQLTRWVVTKEQHAERIIRTISDYFMAQKIKPVNPKNKGGHARYSEMLLRHHAVMVAAMKCKQNASMNPVNALKRAVNGIAGYWKK
jgi:nickel superoxide dismutase